VLETREALAYGRGNVTTDIQASDHESTRRVAIAREITGHMERLHSNFGPSDAAAVAMFVAAGNCGEHARVATSLHVAKLGEAESAHDVTRNGVDHAWCESRSGKGRDHDVVIDPWAEGPAILAPDGEYTRKEKGLRSAGAYRASESYAVSVSIKRTTQQLEFHAPVNLDMRLDELNSQGYRIPRKKVWEPEPVLSTSFARRVGKKLGMQASTTGAKLGRWLRGLVGLPQKERPPNAPLLDQIRAVGVARSLGGSVKTAAKDAAGIVDAAKDLVRSAS
jgi:hypothetical protein